MQKRSVWALAVLVLLAGCSRTRHRQKVDIDTYALLHEKVVESAWHLPSDFDIQPRPDSRLFDPSFIDDPLLPDPSPHLYAYRLPPLPERDPARFLRGDAFVPGMTTTPSGAIASITRIQIGASSSREPDVALVSYQETSRRPEQLTIHRWFDQPPQSDPLPSPMNASTNVSDPIDEQTKADREYRIREEYWEKLPDNCKTRMLEFASVQEEFRRTYERDPEPSELDRSPRFALEDIIDTAQLNSRDYQRQKEILYSVAMRLSLERFDYDLKFSTGGNRTATNYSHARDAGVTVNGLGIPTSVQADKMLSTSADLLARFSNSVVLTFNGPSGFAADVGSDLLLDITQTVFQRDARFERLTQAERDVIYAARDFRRFRKTLFASLTDQYYSLLTSYRSIEIQSQNYFSLVRAFRETNVLVATNQKALFEVDQIEQQVLGARSSLVRQCANLERSLDSLKLSIGLPTETPINLDLAELRGLTLGDQMAVTGELIGRVRARLEQLDEPSREQLLSTAVRLLDRILEFYAHQLELKELVPDSDPQELDRLRKHANEAGLRRLRMLADAARLKVENSSSRVQIEREEEPPNTTVLLQRSRGLIESLVDLHLHQLNYARMFPHIPLMDLEARDEDLRQQVAMLDNDVSVMFEQGELDQLELLVDRVTLLVDQFKQFSRQLDDLSGLTAPPMSPDDALAELRMEAMEIDQIAAEIRSGVAGGLTPIRLEMDDAMLTGLVKRLDLITARNQVADRWRQIKLAADDLKSVLNLNASQIVSTRADVNRAFDFTFDESRTNLSATLDLPFNRRAQRNAFRQRLIDYQTGLRSQTQLEDNIKFDVRADLRALALGKQLYSINVASAALAYEQVINTKTNLRLNLGGIRTRDFLDAQSDYTDTLNDVASGHIDYILDRMQFFLDLELLEVDDRGFWTELHDEQYQPEGYYQLSPEAMPAYGTLPHGLMFSKEMRRMLSVPAGVSMVHGPDDELESVPAEPNTIDLPPPAVDE